MIAKVKVILSQDVMDHNRDGTDVHIDWYFEMCVEEAPSFREVSGLFSGRRGFTFDFWASVPSCAPGMNPKWMRFAPRPQSRLAWLADRTL
jgi:hypothetical protein